MGGGKFVPEDIRGNISTSLEGACAMKRSIKTGMFFIAAMAAIAAMTCAYCAPARADGEQPSVEAKAAAHEGEDGHGGVSPAEALNPISFRGVNFRGDLAIWTLVVFLVVLTVLWKFAWGPIAGGLDKRERKIADDIADAESANQSAKELLEQYQQKLAAAGDEVRGILEQGRRDAERLGRELLAKAKKEAELEQQKALGRIESATDDALKGLADRSAALAVDLAGRIVHEKLDPKQHAHLIERVVADFSQESA